MQHFTILQILFTSLLKYFVEMTEDWSHRKPNTPHLMNRQIDHAWQKCPNFLPSVRKLTGDW